MTSKPSISRITRLWAVSHISLLAVACATVPAEPYDICDDTVTPDCGDDVDIVVE
jgi:hypothetical protein